MFGEMLRKQRTMRGFTKAHTESKPRSSAQTSGPSLPLTPGALAGQILKQIKHPEFHKSLPPRVSEVISFFQYYYFPNLFWICRRNFCSQPFSLKLGIDNLVLGDASGSWVARWPVI